MFHARNDLDPDFAATAALLGDASRARILQALADGRALPATELARSAGVTPQTASTHLARLVDGRMVKVEQFGRHRYFCLTAEAAELLETLAAFTVVPTRRSTQPRDARERNLRFARTCYRHLAGTVGTAITQALCDSGRLRETETGYEVTCEGRSWLLSMDIDAEQLRARPLTRRCLDWSERRPHLGGSLGVALLRRFTELKWLTPLRQPRCLRLTPQGYRALKETLGIQPVLR
jgi:DNA-binding transcriptional ArsR family regulator